MFVRKSIYDAACVENARLQDDVDRLTDGARQLRQMIEAKRSNLEAAYGRMTELADEADGLRIELATTYVRDARGRMRKHPSAGQ